jgi:hypothetical protein
MMIYCPGMNQGVQVEEGKSLSNGVVRPRRHRTSQADGLMLFKVVPSAIAGFNACKQDNINPAMWNPEPLKPLDFP